MAKDIAGLIKEATDAVKDVPEPLREVAFGKAFDALLAERQGVAAAVSPSPKARRKAAKKTPAASGTSSADLLDQIDRTAHPEITHDGTALRNSLHVLVAARGQLGIDGLSAPDIARVLVDKFRCKITRRSVSRALNDAGHYVNRHREGVSVIFRIMAAGEKYLETPTSEAPAKRPAKKKSSGMKRAAVRKKKATPSSDGGKNAAKKGRSVSPAKGLGTLYDADFFSTARMIGEILEELKHKHGRAFKPNEMSTPLLRFVRAGKLTRDQNPDNQYEYKNA